MPLANATISTVSLSGDEGTTQSSGVAYLTVTADDGYQIPDGGLRIGLGVITGNDLNTFYGGNVTNGIEKVVFNYPALQNNQVQVEVHYNSFAWDTATDLYIDIDGKVQRIQEQQEQDIVVEGNPCQRWLDYTTTNLYTQDLTITHATGGSNNGSILVTNLGQIPTKCGDYEEGVTTPSGSISSGLTAVVLLRYGSYGAWQDQGLGYQTGDAVTGGGDTIEFGVQSHFQFLYPGQYVLEYRDQSCHGAGNSCDSVFIPVVVNDNAPSDNSIDDFIFGEATLIEPEIGPAQQVRSVRIAHGANASFEFEAFDLGTGKWYDFNSNAFTTSRTSVIVDRPGTKSTTYYMHFPKVSETARYHMFITPLKNSKINLKKVPTSNNKKFINQRINNTITLSLSSTDNSSNWGSFTTKTLTGRPHSLPKAKVKSQKEVGYKTVPQGAFINVDFSITATFSSGGGKTNVTVDGPPPVYLSRARTEDTIVSYDTIKATNKENDGKEMYVTNKVGISSTSASYSTNTLTVTGKISVEQFGSTSETFYIDIDNFVTLS